MVFRADQFAQRREAPNKRACINCDFQIMGEVFLT
jgi:hypothetical protein